MSAGRFRWTGVAARYAIGDKLALPEVRFVPPPAQSAGAASFMPLSYHY
jgi:hypothetical protein